MSAPTRSASRSPRLLRHGVARGSLAGLGLLVASTAFAPAALAEDGVPDPTAPEQAPAT